MAQPENSIASLRSTILLSMVVNFVLVGALFFFGRLEVERLNNQISRLNRIEGDELDAVQRLSKSDSLTCQPEAGDIIHVNGIGYLQLASPYGHVERQLRCNHRYEWEVLDLIEEYARDGSTVVDAGAYIGTHSLVMSRSVGPLGQVYAFEPVAEVVAQLRRNLKLNGVSNVTVVPKALGESKVTGFMKDPGLVRARACTNEDIERGTLGCDEGVDLEQPFEMVRLDDMPLERVSVVKIDVEGHEFGVLRGARETLERERPVVIIEVWEDARRKGVEGTRAEVLGYLESMGYEMQQLDVRNFLALPIETPLASHP